jgi:dsRNA-specific ribonuclease
VIATVSPVLSIASQWNAPSNSLTAGHRLSVEQFDSQIRQRNACNNFFTAIGRANGIDACILMNAGMGNRASDRMVANAVEAVIGAAYIDAGVNGLAVVNAIMTRLGLDNPPLFST